jgi:hypothetical protein
MRNLCEDVKYVDIRPRRVRQNAIRLLFPRRYERFLRAHHTQFIAESGSVRYDKVIFLQAHQMSVGHLTRLREVQPHAEFTLYNWDSLANHNYMAQAQVFDRVLTFDRLDASEHGFGYLPLFCQRELQSVRRDRAKPGTILMVGNVVKKERYLAVEAFRSYCKEQNFTFLEHLKITPVVYGQLLRAGILPKRVHLRSIEGARIREMTEQAQGVFDFTNHVQTGQTMRMIENLCAGKKIITNNSWVKREPYYSPDRIHVIEGLDFSGIAEFLRAPLKHPEAEFSDYYIQSFTERLLGMRPLPAVEERLEPWSL